MDIDLFVRVQKYLDICSLLGLYQICGKINHFVTFYTSNIYGQNNALYSRSQPFSEYRVSVYTELSENLWNILIRTYILLW